MSAMGGKQTLGSGAHRLPELSSMGPFNIHLSGQPIWRDAMAARAALLLLLAIPSQSAAQSYESRYEAFYSYANQKTDVRLRQKKIMGSVFIGDRETGSVYQCVASVTYQD